MLSVVIPLSDTQNNFIELRYALRSIEKHLKQDFEIVIVGEKPQWIQNVAYIPFTDTSHKQLNIRRKIVSACADPRVTDNFLFSNDDIYFLRDLDEIPYYYTGTLHRVRERGAKVLIRELSAKGLPMRNFDIHTPVIYNKSLFPTVIKNFSDRCVIKSAYCNYFSDLNISETTDLKISARLPYHRIKEEIEGRMFFSTGGLCDFKEMEKVWIELFPNKSKFEI